MVNQLKTNYPEMRGKRIVAASIINRLSEENLRKWENEGIESVCLLKLPNIDYTAEVAPIFAETAECCSAPQRRLQSTASILVCNLPDPRSGVVISDYAGGAFGADRGDGPAGRHGSVCHGRPRARKAPQRIYRRHSLGADRPAQSDSPGKRQAAQPSVREGALLRRMGGGAAGPRRHRASAGRVPERTLRRGDAPPCHRPGAGHEAGHPAGG